MRDKAEITQEQLTNLVEKLEKWREANNVTIEMFEKDRDDLSSDYYNAITEEGAFKVRGLCWLWLNSINRGNGSEIRFLWWYDTDIKELGYDPYIAMLETIKEFESRASWDTELQRLRLKPDDFGTNDVYTADYSKALLEINTDLGDDKTIEVSRRVAELKLDKENFSFTLQSLVNSFITISHYEYQVEILCRIFVLAINADEIRLSDDSVPSKSLNEGRFEPLKTYLTENLKCNIYHALDETLKSMESKEPPYYQSNYGSTMPDWKQVSETYSEEAKAELEKYLQGLVVLYNHDDIITDYEGNKAKLTAERHNQDKTKISLTPAVAVEEVAKVFTFGAGKYAPHQWKGFNKQQQDEILDSLLRHIIAHQKGELYDDESGLLHLAHAGANIAMMLYFIKGEQK